MKAVLILLPSLVVLLIVALIAFRSRRRRDNAREGKQMGKAQAGIRLALAVVVMSATALAFAWTFGEVLALPEVTAPRELYARSAYGIPREAAALDVESVEKAYAMGSTLAPHVLHEYKARLLDAIAEGDSAAAAAATAAYKDLSLLLSLTAHPEKADYNFHMRLFDTDLYVEGDQGNTSYSTARYHVKAAREGWGDDGQLRLLRLKFVPGLTWRTAEEARGMFHVGVSGVSDRASWSIEPFSPTGANGADAFMMAVDVPRGALGEKGEATVTVRHATVTQNQPFTHFAMGANRFKRGFARAVVRLHVRQPLAAALSAYNLSLSSGERSTTGVKVSRPDKADADGWWVYRIVFDSPGDAFIIHYQQSLAGLTPLPDATTP